MNDDLGFEKSPSTFPAVATRVNAFAAAIEEILSQYEKRYTALNEAAMIREIRKHLPTVNSGLVLHTDLKRILKRHYKFFMWRYWAELPQQLNALRHLPEFSLEALQRGDAQALGLSVKTSVRLNQLEGEIGRLTQELKITKTKLMEAMEECEATHEESEKWQTKAQQWEKLYQDLVQKLLKAGLTEDDLRQQNLSLNNLSKKMEIGEAKGKASTIKVSETMNPRIFSLNTNPLTQDVIALQASSSLSNS